MCKNERSPPAHAHTRLHARRRAHRVTPSASSRGDALEHAHAHAALFNPHPLANINMLQTSSSATRRTRDRDHKVGPAKSHCADLFTLVLLVTPLALQQFNSSGARPSFTMIAVPGRASFIFRGGSFAMSCLGLCTLHLKSLPCQLNWLNTRTYCRAGCVQMLTHGRATGLVCLTLHGGSTRDKFWWQGSVRYLLWVAADARALPYSTRWEHRCRCCITNCKQISMQLHKRHCATGCKRFRATEDLQTLHRLHRCGWILIHNTVCAHKWGFKCCACLCVYIDGFPYFVHARTHK